MSFKLRFVLLWPLSLSWAMAQVCTTREAFTVDYSAVFRPEREPSDNPLLWMPGVTRSHYQREYAVVCPESRVWMANPAWKSGLTAHIVSRASGALYFSMYLARLEAGGSTNHKSTLDAAGAVLYIQRLVIVLEGTLQVNTQREEVPLAANSYIYLSPGEVYNLTAKEGGAGLLVYERRGHTHASRYKASTRFGVIDDLPELDVGKEMFTLRKLLPDNPGYHFNVHVMDFEPGEHLVVKEVHYNMHGMLLVQGQGIQRLGDSWHPLQAGDAVWMSPYVPQWFAALGRSRSRYILYKDVVQDPLYSV